MKNLYEILGVTQKATSAEIKKAYNKMLRIYPPEREPEKYREIREAYDTLRNEELRKNYDAYFTYGDEIKKLQNEANEMIEIEEYEEAEKNLKKILIMAPEILEVKKQLSEVFFLEEKYRESLSQLNDLITISPTPSSDYHLRRGHTYLKMNNRGMAEKDFLKAYELDYQNFDAISSIVNLYIHNENIDKAINFLEKEIYRDNSLDFDDFFCLSKLIECYVIKNDENNLKKVIANIEKIAPSDEETKSYMSWKLAKLAFTIATAGYGNLAMEVMKLAKKLTPNNKELEEITHNVYLYSCTQNLINDNRITYQPLKGPIVFYMHGHEVKQEDREENIKIILNDLKSMDIDFLTRIKESFFNLEFFYRELYDQQRELYEGLHDLLIKQLGIAGEFKSFLESPKIIQPIKHCILAIEFNQDDELKKGFDALGTSTVVSVERSLENFSEFPKLKDRYSTFISELEKILNMNHRYSSSNNNRSNYSSSSSSYNSSSSRSSSTSGSSYNNSSSNYSSSNYNSSNYSSSSSSNKHSEGCYIATAVYGDYEAPEVLVLRGFRDKFLKKYVLGRIFIKVYYALSPGLAKKLKKESTITKTIKKVLDRFVDKIKNKY